MQGLLSWHPSQACLTQHGLSGWCTCPAWCCSSASPAAPCLAGAPSTCSTSSSKKTTVGCRVHGVDPSHFSCWIAPFSCSRLRATLPICASGVNLSGMCFVLYCVMQSVSLIVHRVCLPWLLACRLLPSYHRGPSRGHLYQCTCACVSGKLQGA